MLSSLRRSCLFGVGLAIAAITLGCSSADTSLPGGGSGGSQPTGSVSASEGSTASPSGASCASAVAAISYDMVPTSGPSTCKGIDLGKCDVSEAGDKCSYTIDCATHGAITVTVDTSGQSETKRMNVGDGVTADCRANFKGSPIGMLFTCSAQGVTCTWQSRSIQ